MLHLALWLVQKTHTTHSTNQIKDLNQSRHGYPLFPALQAACWFFTLISHLSIAIFSSVLLYTPLKPLFVFLTGFSASPSWSRRINGGWALLSKVSAGGNGQQVRKLGTLTMSKFMDLKTRKGALAQIPLPPTAKYLCIVKCRTNHDTAVVRLCATNLLQKLIGLEDLPLPYETCALVHAAPLTTSMSASVEQRVKKFIFHISDLWSLKCAVDYKLLTFLRAQSWRTVPLIRLALLAVQMVQVCTWYAYHCRLMW